MDQPLIGFKGDPGAVLDDIAGWLRPGLPRRVTVPAVVGKGVRQAVRDLGVVGLKVRTVLLTDDPEPVEGTVARQEPGPGTRLRRGREVVLFVRHPQRRPS